MDPDEVENPDEIEIEDSEDEDEKKAKKEEKVEEEEEDEEDEEANEVLFNFIAPKHVLLVLLWYKFNDINYNVYHIILAL